MFDFLKKKLKEAIGTFTKKAEKEADIVEEPEEKPKETPKPAARAKQAVTKEIKKEKPSAKHRDEKPEIKKIEKAAGKEDTPKKEKVEIKKEAKPKVLREPTEVPVEYSVAKKDSEIQEEAKTNIPEGQKEEKKGFFGKLFSKKEEKKHGIKEEVKSGEPEPAAKLKKPEATEEEKPKGIFGHISDSFTKVSLSDAKFEELFWDLELSMLENNVAVEVIEKIKSDLRQELVDKKLARNSLDKKIIDSLRNSVESLFDVEKIDLIAKARAKKPFIIVMIGINGTGKTTTLAKLINLFRKNKLDCVVAACDTFRAAAIQQLEEHTAKLGVRLIKQDYGSDPAAVAFDAIEHAKAKGKDIVLIDTAGRLHSNSNLMAELEKVLRVSKPDFKLFVGESIAGNDVVEQVKLFNEKVGIDGIVLSKADIDEKGGAAISVSYITRKPILYLGMGQGYDDLAEFDKDKIIGQMGL